MCQPKTKIIINVYHGLIECENCPMDIDVELHDYDIQEIEENNQDRKYGRDLIGDYEISVL